MADVTDAAFRKLIAKYGKPDVFWTEFVSADGLCSQGRENLKVDLIYSRNEHPIVAQIFGGHPEKIKEASRLCRELGFDGIDINMGCPDKKVEKQGAGAAMIKNPKLAIEVIRSAKEGAGDLPVSVKTRIGYSKNEINSWIPILLKENPSALTIHLRTRKEMSDVPAHWDLMREIIEHRNKISPNTLIIGNGDVKDIKDAKQKVKDTGCDGVMLGRAIFGNPWLFKPKKVFTKEKLKTMVEHTKLFEKILGKYKNFAIMKKHYKAYTNSFDGAKELRMKLMEASNAKEVEKIVKNH